jgi:hypothetical protein
MRSQRVPLSLALFMNFATLNGALAQTVLEQQHVSKESGGYGNSKQRVYFQDLWIGKEAKKAHPQDAVVVETEWFEGATWFGTSTVFLSWDSDSQYRKFEIRTSEHSSGDGGGGNIVRWWFPLDVDSDTADEPVFLKVGVGAAHDTQTQREGWSFTPSKKCFEVFYLDNDTPKEIVRHDVSGDKAVELLKKMPVATSEEPPRPEQMKRYWVRLALANANFEAKRPDEAAKDIEQLCKELKLVIIEVAPRNPDYVLGDFDKELDRILKQIAFKNEYVLDEVNVYNPAMIYFTAQDIFRSIQNGDQPK